MIPLPWHIEASNTGTCLYMIWTGLACLNSFINSVVWNSDVINRAPVWCDISSQLIIGSSLAIPAVSLCINRRLYQIASVQSVTKTRAEKRRDVIIDLAIGVGLPILGMILHTIVQAYRFTIIEEVGCFPFTWNTPPAYALYWCWPVVIGLVSASYCIRTIRELATRRAQFKEFLSTNGNLSSSRYFRLMGLACMDILFTIPLSSYVIYLNLTTNSVQAYVNWDWAHRDFSFVVQIPSDVWKANPTEAIAVELSRWSIVLCAVVLFAFFGLAEESRRK
jgi:pheromone a factor receptor